jgi:hypothetical protein
VGISLTVPNAMNASSQPKRPRLRRMYVLSVTVTIDTAKKIDEIMIIASGRPVGTISLAAGSTAFVAIASEDPG